MCGVVEGSRDRRDRFPVAMMVSRQKGSAVHLRVVWGIRRQSHTGQRRRAWGTPSGQETGSSQGTRGLGGQTCPIDALLGTGNPGPPVAGANLNYCFKLQPQVEAGGL